MTISRDPRSSPLTLMENTRLGARSDVLSEQLASLEISRIFSPCE
jgi:hypothetical protein